jgi:hypothetical protein
VDPSGWISLFEIVLLFQLIQESLLSETQESYEDLAKQSSKVNRRRIGTICVRVVSGYIVTGCCLSNLEKSVTMKVGLHFWRQPKQRGLVQLGAVGLLDLHSIEIRSFLFVAMSS